jgi:hypothetical protein
MSQSGVGGGTGWFGLVTALAAFRAGPLRGDPPGRALARAAKVSPTTMGSCLAATKFPQDEGKFLPVMRTVAARARSAGRPTCWMMTAGVRPTGPRTNAADPAATRWPRWATSSTMN